MGLKRFNRVSYLYKSSIAVSLIAGILTGCSSDFSRFTDGLKSSTSSSGKRQNNADETYPPAPQKNTHAKIESGALAPPEPAVGAMADSGDDFAGPDTPPPAPARSLPDKKTAIAAGAAGRPAGKTVYTVQTGDNLTGIARRHNVTIAALKRDNNLSSDKILVGQKLAINGGAAPVAADAGKLAFAGKTSQTVPTPLPEPAEAPPETAPADKAVSADKAKPLEQAENKADTFIKPEEKKNNNEAEKGAVTAGSATASMAIAGSTLKEAAGSAEPADTAPKANESGKGAAGADKKAESAAAMLWPVKGNIISSYGQRAGTSTNDGIDIAVPEGTKVKAADKGIVIYAGDGLKEFGNTILIRHEDNVVTVYGHNSKLLVQRGQQVGRGDDIALSGSSGNASAAKLHFEVRKNSSPVNPMKYLSPAEQL